MSCPRSAMYKCTTHADLFCTDYHIKTTRRIYNKQNIIEERNTMKNTTEKKKTRNRGDNKRNKENIREYRVHRQHHAAIAWHQHDIHHKHYLDIFTSYQLPRYHQDRYQDIVRSYLDIIRRYLDIVWIVIKISSGLLLRYRQELPRYRDRDIIRIFT